LLKIQIDLAPADPPMTMHQFSLFLADNRERTGKILFFRPILPLFGSFLGKITTLFQSVTIAFPCYFDNREAPARNREAPHP
jgi:hypothetical protein